MVPVLWYCVPVPVPAFKVQAHGKLRKERMERGTSRWVVAAK